MMNQMAMRNAQINYLNTKSGTLEDRYGQGGQADRGLGIKEDAMGMNALARLIGQGYSPQQARAYLNLPPLDDGGSGAGGGGLDTSGYVPPDYRPKSNNPPAGGNNTMPQSFGAAPMQGGAVPPQLPAAGVVPPASPGQPQMPMVPTSALTPNSSASPSGSNMPPQTMMPAQSLAGAPGGMMGAFNARQAQMQALGNGNTGMPPQLPMQPGAGPAQQPQSLPSMYYKGTPQSPLVPVGGQGGFDFNQWASTRAQQNAARLDYLQNGMNDPNAPRAWKAAAQKEINQLDTNTTTLWERKNQATANINTEDDRLAKLNENYRNKGGGALDPYITAVQNARAGGNPYDPQLINNNYGFRPDQLQKLSAAAQAGTLTPLQRSMMSTRAPGLQMSKDSQGNPVFVDQNGIEQQLPPGGMAQLAQAQVANLQARTALSQGNLKFLTDIKMPNGALTTKILTGKVNMLPDDKAKLDEQIQALRIGNQFNPALIEAKTKEFAAQAGYITDKDKWVDKLAQNTIDTSGVKTANSSGHMAQDLAIEKTKNNIRLSHIAAALDPANLDTATGNATIKDGNGNVIQVIPPTQRRALANEQQQLKARNVDIDKASASIPQPGVSNKQNSGPSPFGDSGPRIGQDFGSMGCARGVCAISKSLGLNLPNIQSAGGLRNWMGSHGWQRTSDPSQSQVFFSPSASANSKWHTGIIKDGASYQADRVVNGKPDTTLQQYEIPRGKGVEYWTKSGGVNRTSSGGVRNPKFSKLSDSDLVASIFGKR